MTRRSQPTDPAGPLTPAVFHVLLALAEGPLHGYAIMQAAQDSAGSSLRMGPGTVYGTLQRLEQAGFVEEVESRSAGRRKIFTLLPAGRRALETEAARLAELADLVRRRRLVPSEA